MKFDIQPNQNPLSDTERQAALATLKFGQVFTDHMITIQWSEERGWHDGRLTAYCPIALAPAASIFHYGQEIFEGMKAYRQADGTIALFRPEMNAARFNASARRLAMPELPAETFVHAIERLLRQDREWVPDGEGNSLYLRPFMIATQPTLGFTLPSRSYLFCIIASPAPAYFGALDRPSTLTVWLCEDYSRAAPGGTGAAKAGGNYAAAFRAQRQAVEQGCDQVVWLDAVEHIWVEEMGGMNLCFVHRPEDGDRPTLMTPALTGTLLPGVTRDSLLQLAHRLGIGCEEGRISIHQWRKQCELGRITEVFACGTAAVIAPVGKVRGSTGEWVIGSGEPGPVTRRLRDELLGIQYGRRSDELGWMHKVCRAEREGNPQARPSPLFGAAVVEGGEVGADLVGFGQVEVGVER
jgi:branched-chain amino acid aminotransferase